MSFERILDNREWDWDFEKVYIYPHIPMKKLQGAINAYAPQLEPRDILVLLDDTVFGGAREGLIVARDGLYSKQLLEEPSHVQFQHIREISPGTSGRIHVNGHEFFKAHIIPHSAMNALAKRLNQFVQGGGAQQSGGVPRMGKELVQIHQSALRALARHVDEEYDASELDFPGLIDAHFVRILQELPTLTRHALIAPERASTVQGQNQDIVTCALLGFILFHASSFARTPDGIKAELGDAFSGFATMHMHYRDFFLQGVRRSLGEVDNDKQQLFEMAALMFMFRDSDTDFQLTMPREEAFAKLVARLGFSPTEQRSIERDFDQTLAKWWAHVESLAADQNDDEYYAEDDEEDEEPRHHGSRSSGHGAPGGLAAHADTLGVRPGASRNEIELAYRGRRSQYHPDRYAGEGPEAVEWATGRMKEVNVAYQALVDAAG